MWLREVFSSLSVCVVCSFFLCFPFHQLTLQKCHFRVPTSEKLVDINAQALALGRRNQVFAPNKPDCGTACKLYFDLFHSFFFLPCVFRSPPSIWIDLALILPSRLWEAADVALCLINQRDGSEWITSDGFSAWFDVDMLFLALLSWQMH